MACHCGRPSLPLQSVDPMDEPATCGQCESENVPKFVDVPSEPRMIWVEIDHGHGISRSRLTPAADVGDPE